VAPLPLSANKVASSLKNDPRVRLYNAVR